MHSCVRCTRHQVRHQPHVHQQCSAVAVFPELHAQGRRPVRSQRCMRCCAGVSETPAANQSDCYREKGRVTASSCLFLSLRFSAGSRRAWGRIGVLVFALFVLAALTIGKYIDSKDLQSSRKSIRITEQKLISDTTPTVGTCPCKVSVALIVGTSRTKEHACLHAHIDSDRSLDV